MRRYFFDVVGRKRAEYDYRGRDFPAPDKAFRLAELMALDLAMEADDEWAGFSVKVRNADGGELFQVPVQPAQAAV
jgi:hypothetical protein